MTREPGTGDGSFSQMLYHGEDSSVSWFCVHDGGGVKVVVRATVSADGEEKDDDDATLEPEEDRVEVAKVVLEAAAAVDAATDVEPEAVATELVIADIFASLVCQCRPN